MKVKKEEELDLWLAGGALWLNLINIQPLAAQGLGDATASIEDFKDWVGNVGLKINFKPTVEDLNKVRLALGFFDSSLKSLLASGEVRVDELNRMSKRFKAWIQIEKRDERYQVTQHYPLETVEELIGLVAVSMTETLAVLNPKRLRKCDNPDCQMHFYDDSKGGRRRWCTMAICGNRIKANRFYHQHRASR